jgi:hypothetical protein
MGQLVRQDVRRTNGHGVGGRGVLPIVVGKTPHRQLCGPFSGEFDRKAGLSGWPPCTSSRSNSRHAFAKNLKTAQLAGIQIED